MARAIVMPGMGMYTDQGTLSNWLRPSGAEVRSGDAVAEVTTDKATYELQAPSSGLLHQLALVGDSLPVEAVLGYILSSGEAPPPSPDQGSPATATADSSDRAPAASAADASPVLSSAPLRASPIARRLAAEHGINLADVIASGPGGRIVEADVLAAVAQRAAHAPQEPTMEARAVERRLPLTGMRGTIAQKLRHSLATAAAVTLTREIAADALVTARSRLGKPPDSPPPYDAIFIKVLAAALRDHPSWNATVEGDEILELSDVNIGFAVAVTGGLVVPVVRNADTQPLRAIAASVRELRHRTHSGGLRPGDLSMATATVSNLGAHGVDAFTPILGPGQSVILGTGRIAQRAVVRDGQITVGHTCMLSLTFDHRVADGAPAADLLSTVAQLLGDSGTLMTWAD